LDENNHEPSVQSEEAHVSEVDPAPAAPAAPGPAPAEPGPAPAAPGPVPAALATPAVEAPPEEEQPAEGKSELSQPVHDEQPDKPAPAKDKPRKAAADEKHKSRARRVFNWIGNIVFVLFLVFLAFLVLVTLNARAGGASSFFGYSLFTVETGSMAPEIPEGSVVFTLKKPADEIKEKDVITFFATSSYVTHRVAGINFEAAQPGVEGYEEDYYSFVTKGDANNTVDERRVPYDDVRGVVILTVPLLGYLLDFLRPPNLGLLIVVVPCLIIIVVELTKLVRFAKESKTSAEP